MKDGYQSFPATLAVVDVIKMGPLALHAHLDALGTAPGILVVNVRVNVPLDALETAPGTPPVHVRGCVLWAITALMDRPFQRELVQFVRRGTIALIIKFLNVTRVSTVHEVRRFQRSAPQDITVLRVLKIKNCAKLGIFALTLRRKNFAMLGTTVHKVRRF